MPGWLKSAYNWAIGGLSDLWGKTLGLIGTLYSFVTSVVNDIHNGMNDIYNGLVKFIDAVEKYAENAITQLSVWVTSLYNQLGKYISSLISGINNYINQLYKWAVGLFNDAANALRKAVSDITGWVIKNIYNPIAGAIQTLANWITQYGYVAYTLVTHPDQLASILGKYIWKDAASLADHYAAPIGAWLLRGMLKMANPFGKVIEDIIAALID